MIFVSIGQYIVRWRYSFHFWKFVRDLFAAFGVLWTLVDIAAYITSQSRDWVITYWWSFLVVAFLWAVWSCRPHDCFSYKLKRRDAVVEIRVTDIFRIRGSIVVPVNTSFDTDIQGRIINANSVQGAFTRKFYKGDVTALNQDIDQQLIVSRSPSHNASLGKPGKQNVYPVGSVITIGREKRTFYLLAASAINQNGRANCEVDDLKLALSRLWEYIREQGDKGTVVIPIIGTGHARLPISREDAVRMIIRSFIESCSDKTYCDRLVIAVHPGDVKKFQMDLNDLEAFLKYSCDYVDFVAQQASL